MSRGSFVAPASLLLFGAFGVILVALIDKASTPAGQLLIFATFFALGPVLAGLGSAWLPWARLNSVPRWRLVAVPPTAMVIATTLVWGLLGIQTVVYNADPAPYSTERFQAGLGVGALLVLIALPFAALRAHRPIHRPRFVLATRVVALAIAAGLAMSLFDVHVFADSLSYAPYVGPATLVLHGGIPLRDTFSQYGLNYLVFAGALKALPYSLATAAAVVAVLNVAYYLAYVLIAFKFSRNKVLIMVAASVTLLFLSSAYSYNASRTPSVLGARFLPPLLVVLGACYLRPGRLFSPFSIGCLVAASLWSVESLALGVAAYAAYVLISGRLLRASAGAVAVNLVRLAAIAGLPHLILTAVWLIAFHQPPEYGTYLELVVGASTDPSVGWAGVADPDVHAWLIFGWVYGLGLAYAVYRGASHRVSDAGEAGRVAVLASVCVLGAGEFAYFVARSTTPLLVFLAWPLALVGLWALDHSVSLGLRRLNATRVVTLALAGAACVVMCGVFSDRFFRRIDPVSSNSTVLRWVVDSGPNPAGIASETLSRMRRVEPFPPPDIEDLPGAFPRRVLTYSYPYLQGALAFRLSQKWQAQDPKPLLVLPESPTVLFYARKVSRLGLADPAVDGLSKTLATRGLDNLATLASGDVVIVGNPAAWSQPIPFDEAVLQRLGEQGCALSELEQASDYPGLSPEVRERIKVTAYRLTCNGR